MFQRLINMIKEAIRKMVGYKAITEAVNVDDNIVSNVMSERLDLWKDMYKNIPKWANDTVKPMNVPKTICELISLLMTNELNLRVVPEEYNVESGDEISEDSFAAFMQNVLDKHLLNKLREKIERALALGGCVIKPYVSNKQIYFDFVEQGDFYPIAFDDDGNITDIAFIDQFVNGDMIYTKVERQTFADNKIVVENKAYMAKYVRSQEIAQPLGIEIDLKSITKWADIDPNPPAIEGVDRPLFGYFKVAKSNNVDMKSPLGISIFEPAVYVCERLDKQFARLDWEYDGGQLAIDVDPTAFEYAKEKYSHLPQYNDRVFRFVDLGQDETYKPYSPNLRDSNFIAGVNEYKMEIEDLIGLARGSLAKIDVQGRTATELKILKHKSFNTIHSNQEALDSCLKDVVIAAKRFVELYAKELGVSPEEFDIVIDWGDSVLVDKETEAGFKLELTRENIMSKAEFRAWYMNEPLDVAAENIQAIIDTNKANFLGDIMDQDVNSDNEDEDKDEDNTDNDNE